MATIIEERTISVDPKLVFSALIQQDEIARWWTDDVSAQPEVGSILEVRFRRGAVVLQLELTGLDIDKKVSWYVKNSPIVPWNGTSIIWQLTPVHNGTKVVFTQEEFAQADEGYEETRRGWQYFLDSLVRYLETGEGTPDTDSRSRPSTRAQG